MAIIFKTNYIYDELLYIVPIIIIRGKAQMLDKKVLGPLLVFLLAVSVLGAAMMTANPKTSDMALEDNLTRETQTTNSIIQPLAELPMANNTTINVKIDIDPDTLNLKSNGNWITCYIELPSGYNASDINASTILLNGSLPPVLDPKYGFVKDEKGYLTDHDGNNVTERMLKFDRASVQSLLSPGESVNVSVTGKLYSNRSFQGQDTIRVIKPPEVKMKKDKPKDNKTDVKNDTKPDKAHGVKPDTTHGAKPDKTHGAKPDKKDDPKPDKTDDAKPDKKPDKKPEKTHDAKPDKKDTTEDTEPKDNTSSNITAKIKIAPVTINLKSKGNWVTCFIELPSGYNVSHINASTVLLGGNITPILDPKFGFANESKNTTDDDDNGTKKRMFKFDRQAVYELLSGAKNKEVVELTITGKVNGILFEGIALVKVIKK